MTGCLDAWIPGFGKRGYIRENIPCFPAVLLQNNDTAFNFMWSHEDFCVFSKISSQLSTGSPHIQYFTSETAVTPMV